MTHEELDALLKAGPRVGLYRHYRGNLYRVLVSGWREDDLEPVVVYQSLITGEVWVRTAESWEASMRYNDVYVPRFERVREEVT